MIRSAGRRVGECDPEELALLLALHDEIDRAVEHAVAGLRVNFTWAAIGEATGTTGQAANMKWG
jgi:hypothetical protein